MNAVIVDLKGKNAAALDENGNVIKIPNANYAIGQKIQLHAVSQKSSPSLKRIGTVAAAAALILSIGTGTACATPYGTVSLDADAAIEYTINRFDRVLSVRALNEEGEAVLADLDGHSLRFRPVEEAINTTLEQQELSREGAPAVQITTKTRDEHHTERLQEHLMDRIPAAAAPPVEGTPDDSRKWEGSGNREQDVGMAPPDDDGKMAPDIPQSGTIEDRHPEHDDLPDLSQEKTVPAVTPDEEHSVSDHMIPDSAHNDGKEPPSGGAEPQGAAGMQPPSGSKAAHPQQELFGMPSMSDPSGPPPQK
ncbi:MAG: hypothetical protein K6C12_01280 [Oscillospiraceae bacterium]|nr:hypothetical protein [Oscillospiraceae bacterium]